MKLKLILPQLDRDLFERYGNLEISGISCNSQTVSQNYIFVAIRGSKLDANKFISQAIEKGARVIISDSVVGCPDSGKVIFLKVEDSRASLAEVASNFYGHPSEKIKVVGITGTNGKTTVSYLLEHILTKAGFDTGVIGTINYRLKDKLITAVNTTPGPIEIQSLLLEMLRNNLKYCVMEVSSHALDQKRTLGVEFSSAIFTNFTGDHLDYHLNLENYFAAKARLFESLSKTAYAIINRDDAYSERLSALTPAKILTYGISHKDSRLRAEDLELSIYGSKFKLVSKKGTMQIKTNLLGKYNVYNILAGFAFCLTQNLDLELAKQAIEEFKGVPGRLEEVGCGLDFKVFVDFAHTADALSQVLKSLKEFTPRRIILVFGCGGDRDRTKRQLMGRIAEEISDFSIITSDNPRSEEPSSIAEEITRGMKEGRHKIILDRSEAINEAISMAKKDDIVLICGKGHEKYQIFKEHRVEFDDRQEAEKALKCLR